MTEKEFFEKNLVLTTAFDRYVLEYPEIAEQIPLNAQIVLLPEDDPEFCQKNREVDATQRELTFPGAALYGLMMGTCMSEMRTTFDAKRKTCPQTLVSSIIVEGFSQGRATE